MVLICPCMAPASAGWFPRCILLSQTSHQKRSSPVNTNSLDENNVDQLTETPTTKREIMRSKYEHTLHMTLANSLKSRPNRHHPSPDRRKNHPRMTASHLLSDLGTERSIGKLGSSEASDALSQMTVLPHKPVIDCRRSAVVGRKACFRL